MSKMTAAAALDASLYYSRRRIGANSSSIRKLIRGRRIEAGLRPLDLGSKRVETKLHDFRPHGGSLIAETITRTLHPTKGFRSVKHAFAYVDA